MGSAAVARPGHRSWPRASPAAGGSDTASAFGASVDLGRTPRSLCLIVSPVGTGAAHVRAVGGQVVVDLPDAPWVLAVLGFEELVRVRERSGVRAAGPVQIDPDRFAAFLQLVGAPPDPDDGDERAPGTTLPASGEDL